MIGSKFRTTGCHHSMGVNPQRTGGLARFFNSLDKDAEMTIKLKIILTVIRILCIIYLVKALEKETRIK